MKRTIYLLSILLFLTGLTASTSHGDRCSDEYSQDDVNYLQSMIEHHEGAVEMAEMVPENTERSELVNLSEDVIQVQRSEINRMESMIDSACVEPEAEEEQHIAPTERQVNYLGSLNGTEFDLMFINFMAAHHADASMESDIIMREGRSEEVKELARNITEAQTQEIEQMYGWYTEWS